MTDTDYQYMTIIAAPPERVWEGLTTAEFTRQYWHGTDIRSSFTEGAPLEFIVEDGSAGVTGRILKADRPRELVYTWSFASQPDEPESRVSFRLERLDVGTRLTVTHDKLVAGSKSAEMIAVGWPHVICGLKTLLETGKAIDFSRAEVDEAAA